MSYQRSPGCVYVVYFTINSCLLVARRLNIQATQENDQKRTNANLSAVQKPHKSL